MKKITITTAAGTREANANEYPLRSEPKSQAFEVQVNGVKCRARATSGKGKSAVNNHYFYFVEGQTMFYVRTTPDELAALKAEGASVTDVKEAVAATDTTPTLGEAIDKLADTKPEVKDKPKARRAANPKARRAAKATA